MQHIVSRLLFQLLPMLILASNAAYADEFVDVGTQRHGMHSCPTGSFVTGVHFSKNQLLCADGYGAYKEDDEFVDGDDEPPTQRNGMHSCPENTAITGLHVQKNLLSCARFDPSLFGKAGWQAKVGNKTQRHGMHACPESRPVLAIHVWKNLLSCISLGIE